MKYNLSIIYIDNAGERVTFFTRAEGKKDMMSKLSSKLKEIRTAGGQFQGTIVKNLRPLKALP